jgi:hypothetical protein
VRDVEHRKQLLIQQIADHRELMRLEMEILQESPRIKPVIEITHRLLGIFGTLRATRRAPGGGGVIDTSRAPFDIEIVRTTLPVLVPVMRAMLHRHKERRAKKKQAQA